MRTALSKNDLDTTPPGPPPVAAPTQPEPNSYVEQVAKNIPTEVIAFYIPALAAAAGGKGVIQYDYVVWLIFALALVGTFGYTYRNAMQDLTDNKIMQYKGQKAFWKSVISTVAFVIWALYLGGPFASVAGYSTYGTLLILGYTFITPAINDAIPIPFAHK
jgi:hypothetical protein